MVLDKTTMNLEIKGLRRSNSEKSDKDDLKKIKDSKMGSKNDIKDRQDIKTNLKIIEPSQQMFILA